MSLRRRRPLAPLAERVALELQRSQGSVALLDRSRPLNLSDELSRLRQAFEAGQRPAPAFTYAPRPQLAELRRRLSELTTWLDPHDAEQLLLAERARELGLEAELVEQVGEPTFAALAEQRFPLPDDGGQARRLVEQFLTAPAEAAPATDAETLHLSDDARDPHSLWSQVSLRLSRERFAVRIELWPGLVSLAAVADGVVRIRPGARLTARVGRRIALHEVEGHVRPRVFGQALGGVFFSGTARASEDEEGRAILLEERGGFLDVTRRKELARRYVAAETVRQGAQFWDTVEQLGKTGATAPAAVELACRAHRGGGLGRELIYLLGYFRVARALAARPELERLLESGRVSISAAEALLVASIELDDDGDVV